MIDFIDRGGERQWHIPEGDMLPCPAELNAESADGMEHTVYVRDPMPIGAGHFGIIYTVTATVVATLPLRDDAAQQSLDGHRRRGHSFKAVVKVFYNEEEALKALENYDVCRDAGLRVAPTYRCDSRQGVVLMTDLGRTNLRRPDLGHGNAYAVSCNNWSIGAEVLSEDKIQRIQHWQEILAILFTNENSEVRRAAKAEIEFREDALFFIVPTEEAEGGRELDVSTIDVDAISHPIMIGYDRLLIRNVLAVRTSCEKFIRKFVAREHRQEYLLAIDAACRGLLPAGARGVAD